MNECINYFTCRLNYVLIQYRPVTEVIQAPLRHPNLDESYGKIKESIILKIQKTFTSLRLIVESISANEVHVFSVPELQ